MQVGDQKIQRNFVSEATLGVFVFCFPENENENRNVLAFYHKKMLPKVYITKNRKKLSLLNQMFAFINVATISKSHLKSS